MAKASQRSSLLRHKGREVGPKSKALHYFSGKKSSKLSHDCIVQACFKRLAQV